MNDGSKLISPVVVKNDLAHMKRRLLSV